MPDDSVDGVVAAFDQNVRLERADELQRSVFLEENNGVYSSKRSHHTGAFAFADDGAAGTLETADRCVGIQAEDELRAEAAAILEQRYVADVQKIEAAIGEDDGLARGAPFGDAFGMRSRSRIFSSAVMPELGVSSCDQLMRGDGNCAGLADDDAGGKVGQLDGRIDGQTAGESGRKCGDDGIPGSRDVEYLARTSW